MRQSVIRLACLVTLLSGGTAHGEDQAALVTPAPVRNVLEVRRFKLATPFVYSWSKEKLEVSAGALVVLEVDPRYLVPDSSLRPVLYAGDLPVQRLNQGD